MDRPGLVAAGQAVEAESFRIIDREMGAHAFPPEQWEVVRRVIHTTGDFDYADRIRFRPESLAPGVRALRAGASIFADTRMIQVGLSPWRLGWFGNPVVVPAAEPEAQAAAEQQATTRTAAAFRNRARELEGSVVAVGNAPTALLEVVRLAREENLRPALVVGVPVGFVNAEASKTLLWETESLPCITVLGRKGGSTVAVAVLHALLELARRHPAS
ncbi:MAG: precorrin-8X methylmutase [Thermodesulfobacteriota bacterium]|nr:precorrin-8X methylmutase [Thermodesulfobacteriota bacterium]